MVMIPDSNVAMDMNLNDCKSHTLYFSKRQSSGQTQHILTYPQLDVVSDYMASDTEDFVPTAMLLKREKFRMRFRSAVEPKKSTRYNPHLPSISEWFPHHQVQFFTDDSYRFNATK